MGLQIIDRAVVEEMSGRIAGDAIIPYAGAVEPSTAQKSTYVRLGLV